MEIIKTKPITFFSATPSKVAIYTRQTNMFTGVTNISEIDEYQKNKKTVSNNKNSLENLKKNSHRWELSKMSADKINNKIQWLFYYAKKRNITSYSKKIIINFKIGFYTFTLPSRQQHSTKEITKSCFVQLLNELRTRVNMKNYIWKLEFQKNGNVHYHLVTDSYLDFFFIKRVWNRIINKLGYVDRYQEKFANMTFSDYLLDYDHGELSTAEIAIKFNDFKINGAGEPPSVNVQGVRSSHNIGAYIAKYMSKSNKGAPRVMNDFDNEDTSNIRLWFCSQSLSKFDKFRYFLDASHEFINDMIMQEPTAKTVFHDYCTVIYFNFKSLGNWLKSNFAKIFYDYRLSLNYEPI